MPFIQWSPSFSVGNAVLDADHRKLIDILNQIYDAWTERNTSVELLEKLFDELMDYTDGHFAREESKLADREYADITRHHAAHERLRELVHAFRGRHIAGQKADALTEDMAKFLKSWLIEHILEEDMQYRPLFTGK